MNGIKHLQLLSIFTLCVASSFSLVAQEQKAVDEKVATISAETKPQTKEQAKASIKKAFDLSRKVSSIDDLEQILTWLGDVNLKVILEKDIAYIRSLEGWALNAKAKRLVDDIERFRRIEKEDQAKESLQNAIDTFTASIEKDDQRCSSYRQRGVLYASEAKDFEKAIADFNQAIRIQPDDQSSWFNRAEVRYAQKQFEIAVGDYTEAIQLKATDVQALTGRGHCYLQLGHLEEAITDYLAVTKLMSEDTDALTNLAGAYQANKQWIEAEEAFRSALKASEENARAYAQVAWLYATCPEESLQKPQIAMQAIKRSIKLTGTENAKNLEVLAAVHAANGDFTTAARTQERAIELGELADDESMQVRLKTYSSSKQFRQRANGLR